jgi:thioredoxin-related protein
VNLLFALLVLASAQEAKIQWTSDHANALQEAKKAGKYLIVHFVGPDCPWCEKMDKETYRDPGIIDFSNKGFINVGLDKERDKALAAQYKVGPIPVTFVLSPDGERVSTLLGYMPAEDYKSGIEAALAGHKKLVDLLPRIKAAPADPALLREAGELYGELGDEKKAGDFLVRASEKTADPAARGELLVKAFHYLNDAPADNEVNQAMLSVADRMDALDADGKLGLQDNAAYVRAMVDFNKENWDGVIQKLQALVAKWPDGEKAPPALLTLANVYHEAKHDNAKAQSALKTLIEKYPKSDFVERAKEMQEHLKKHDEK